MSQNPFIAHLVRLPISTLAIAVVLLAQGRGARPAFQENSITAARPLSYIANTLEARYGTPVTYEDPIWQWQGDFVPGPDMPVPGLRWRTATLSPDLNPVTAPTLDAAAMGRVLDEYHKANDAPRYRVLQSSFGLHIVPVLVRDADGNLVPSKNPLDAVVSVPVGVHTASEHFMALCAAASKSASMEIECSAVGFRDNWLERLFAPRGGTLEWGASAVSARAALIDLLGRSATTFTWRFNCGPDPTRPGMRCVLNIQRLQVADADRTRVVVSAGDRPSLHSLEYDRCPECRPVPRK